MRKILIVANVSKEHIRKFYIPLIALMRENNWVVDVACRLDEPVSECDKAHDLPCDRNPFRGGILKSVRILKNIIRQNNYDVLMCSTVVGSIVARLAASSFRRNGLKVIYLNNGLHFFPGASALRWAMGYPVEKFLAFKTDVMITSNDTDFKTARKYLRIPIIEKTHSMGVNLNRFRDGVPSNVERTKQRELLGISPDDFVLSYVAEIIDNKNQSMLLEAFEHIRKALPNAKLLLIGPEHDGGNLHNAIESKGLQSQVLLLGWRSDVPLLLYLSDVYVASSKSEGLGLNLIEAMACNLPVVATNNRGHAEIINHGSNGFLVEINDSNRMAFFVLKLHDDVALRNALTTQAQQDIEKYKTEAAINELFEVIVRHT